MSTNNIQKHRIVIVGGGFGGLYAAKSLGKVPATITVVDKRNFHLFQPLLYQVATGIVSPADIASPLRSILSTQRNTTVLLDEAIDLDPDAHQLLLRDCTLSYDTLILATGVRHHYFGNDAWQESAPGLKTIEDALNIRRRIYSAFEAAERESDPERRRAWLTFAIVGAGPTGVELAGAIAELAQYSLKDDFRHIDTQDTQIYLLEGADRVLPPYDPKLSTEAAKSLEEMGVTIRTGSLVSNIDGHRVTLRSEQGEETLFAQTVLWAAGVQASRLGQVLADKTGVELDRAGRVKVNPDLSVADYDDLFVIGDLAHVVQDDTPLPGVAPVAMQQGKYMAALVRSRLAGESVQPFRYVDKGSLAVIGQNRAVVDLGFLKLTGPIAWLLWVFAHLFYLIEFDNKLIVLTQWGWSYFTRNRGARLIAGETISLQLGNDQTSPYSEPVDSER
ncbi:MAG: NAD(P)/FAD-dependent oxidoreductase [Cyanobacteria bacterium P01_E01_bin.34]